MLTEDVLRGCPDIKYIRKRGRTHKRENIVTEEKSKPMEVIYVQL